tara:strand:- start:755 stop:1279 length:525 start_codon:yes stop_codon:yes gene_type:complete
MSDIPENSSYSNLHENKKVKSELFHIWKKARLMYDTVKDDSKMEDWVKKNITKAYELIDEAIRYAEYEKIFPSEQRQEEAEEDKNNFLSNQDKRYPTPAAQETGDQFITRCILDANMKKRYPVQGDRFSACMSIYNSKKEDVSEDLHNNPGEKFEDPMENKEPELPNPVKPILP